MSVSSSKQSHCMCQLAECICLNFQIICSNFLFVFNSLKFKLYLSNLPNVFVCLNNQTVSSCKLSHCMCRPQIAVSSPLPDISIWPPKTHPPHSRQLAECIYLKKMSTSIGLIIAKCICLLVSLACLPPWHFHMTLKTPPHSRHHMGLFGPMGKHPNTNIKDNFTSGTLTFKIDEKSHNCLLLSLSSCIT